MAQARFDDVLCGLLRTAWSYLANLATNEPMGDLWRGVHRPCSSGRTWTQNIYKLETSL